MYKWPDKLYINQNLITLVVCYVGVVYAEKNDLCHLFYASWYLFTFSSISVMITIIFYTIHYCKNKWNK